MDYQQYQNSCYPKDTSNPQINTDFQQNQTLNRHSSAASLRSTRSLNPDNGNRQASPNYSRSNVSETEQERLHIQQAITNSTKTLPEYKGIQRVLSTSKFRAAYSIDEEENVNIQRAIEISKMQEKLDLVYTNNNALQTELNLLRMHKDSMMDQQEVQKAYYSERVIT